MTLTAGMLGLGAIVGLVLALFGGGGSVLAVPALVHLAGSTPHEATTVTLGTVALAAATGLGAHARAGRVQWRTGGALALAGVAGAVGGAALSALVAGAWLLVLFAGVMLVAAWRLWRSGDGVGADRERLHGRALVLRASGAGLLTGFVTGFFGIGGGFVIVPVLVLLFGLTLPAAVATSLLVIVVNAAGGLAVRLASAQLDWTVALPFVAAAVPAALVGERIVTAVDSRQLQRAFAVALAVIAVYTGVDAVLA